MTTQKRGVANAPAARDDQPLRLKTIDLAPLSRGTQRLFAATEWLFVLGMLAICGAVSASLSGEVDEDQPNVTFLTIYTLLYGYQFAIMDYRRRYWRNMFWVNSFIGFTLMVFLVVAGSVSLAGIGGGDQDPVEGVAVLLVIALPAYWFLRQWLSARRLLRAPGLDGAKRGFSAAMEKTDAIWRAQVAAGYGAPPRNSRLGVALSTLALGVIGAVVAAFFVLAATPETSVVNHIAAGVVGLGVFGLPISAILLGYGRKLAQPDAKLLLDTDDRDPILLLRSFKDDEARLSPRSSFRRFLYLGFYGRVRLEYALSDELARLGPFIGVGQPGERLPDLGAARAYLDDDQWQEQVLDWIDRARLILVIGGTTPWVGWELRQICEKQKLDRMILLLPPSGWFAASKRRQRYEMIRDALAGTPWEAVASEDALEHVVGLFSTADGQLIAYRSKSPKQVDYELILRVAIAEKFALQHSEDTDAA